MKTDDVTKMTDAEFSQYMHGHRLDLMSRYLAEAVRWRDESRRCVMSGTRALSRRNMRQSALSWLRHWHAL